MEKLFKHTPKSAGYKLLYLLAISDKQLHNKELEVLDGFLDKCFPGEQEPSVDRYTLTNLTYENKLRLLVDIAEYLKDKLDRQKLSAMFKYALHVVICDRKIMPNEDVHFKIVSKFWDLDIKQESNRLLNVRPAFESDEYYFIDLLFADGD